jgi:hypothetical protein
MCVRPGATLTLGCLPGAIGRASGAPPAQSVGAAPSPPVPTVAAAPRRHPGMSARARPGVLGRDRGTAKAGRTCIAAISSANPGGVVGLQV